MPFVSIQTASTPPLWTCIFRLGRRRSYQLLFYSADTLSGHTLNRLATPEAECTHPFILSASGRKLQPYRNQQHTQWHKVGVSLVLFNEKIKPVIYYGSVHTNVHLYSDRDVSGDTNGKPSYICNMYEDNVYFLYPHNGKKHHCNIGVIAHILSVYGVVHIVSTTQQPKSTEWPDCLVH